MSALRCRRDAAIVGVLALGSVNLVSPPPVAYADSPPDPAIVAERWQGSFGRPRQYHIKIAFATSPSYGVDHVVVRPRRRYVRVTLLLREPRSFIASTIFRCVRIRLPARLGHRTLTDGTLRRGEDPDADSPLLARLNLPRTRCPAAHVVFQ